MPGREGGKGRGRGSRLKQGGSPRRPNKAPPKTSTLPKTKRRPQKSTEAWPSVSLRPPPTSLPLLPPQGVLRTYRHFLALDLAPPHGAHSHSNSSPLGALSEQLSSPEPPWWLAPACGTDAFLAAAPVWGAMLDALPLCLTVAAMAEEHEAQVPEGI
jgi:hypothetical protein